MKFLEPNLQAHPLLFSWRGVVIRVLWLSQGPDAWVPSLAGPRVLHEAKEVAAGASGKSDQDTARPRSSWLYADVASQQSDPTASYTMFSAPGRGPCGGPRSCLLCNWANCRTGMLHRGHTFRTSSHLIRHFLWKACLHGQIPNSSRGLKSSRHTAQSSCKFNSFTFSFNIT